MPDLSVTSVKVPSQLLWIELVGLAFVVERAGIVVGGVVGAILGIELHVAADKEIDASILVVVEPGGADGPAVDLDAGLLSDIGEVAVAVVVVENHLAVAGDKQVVVAVVVVVGSGDRHRVHVGIEAGLLGHIGEVSVAIVAIEMVVRQRAGFSFSGYGCMSRQVGGR